MHTDTKGVPLCGQPSLGNTALPTDPFESLGIPPAAASILRYFLLRPQERPHARKIQRLLALGGASLQRELLRLTALGALQRSKEGRRVHFSIDQDSALWAAFRIIMGTTPDPTALVRDALRDVPGVTAAFLFGSTARGNQRSDSDVDLFVIETPTVDRRKLLRQLAEVGMLSGREVNTLRYTLQTLSERLGDPDHPGAGFVREVLTGPKRWVAGSASAIAPLATAAGLRLPDLSVETR